MDSNRRTNRALKESALSKVHTELSTEPEDREHDKYDTELLRRVNAVWPQGVR